MIVSQQNNKIVNTESVVKELAKQLNINFSTIEDTELKYKVYSLIFEPYPAITGEFYNKYRKTIVIGEKDYISISKEEIFLDKNFMNMLNDFCKRNNFEIDIKNNFIHLYHKDYNLASYEAYKNLKSLYGDVLEIAKKIVEGINGLEIKDYQEKRMIEIIKVYNIKEDIEYKNYLKINYNVYNNKKGFIKIIVDNESAKTENYDIYDIIKKNLKNFNIKFLSRSTKPTTYFLYLSRKDSEEK
jgi:hypothetical protein